VATRCTGLVVRAGRLPQDVDAHLQLARVFESRDREVSLRICTDWPAA